MMCMINLGHRMNNVSIASCSNFSHVAFAFGTRHPESHLSAPYITDISSHFPSSGYRYFIVHCGGGGNTTTSTDGHIRGADSNDLYQWTRNETVFSDVDSTRDPMLFYAKNLSISLLFYTSSQTNGSHDVAYGIFARKSTDLVNWSEKKMEMNFAKNGAIHLIHQHVNHHL